MMMMMIYSATVSIGSVISELQPQRRRRHQLGDNEAEPREKVCRRGSDAAVDAAADAVGRRPCALSCHSASGNAARRRKHVRRRRAAA